MTLYFITGNKDKFKEVKDILGDVAQIKIDLPEIQDIDARKIIREKLMAAFEHHSGEFIVEDTSLYLDCLKGLPGPLIKWFMETIGNEGLAEIAEKLGNNKAKARTIIGYAKSKKEIEFFEGSVSGKIFSPRGSSGFGWDRIFSPDGHDRTFSEMSSQEKNKMSMRRIALNKLKEHLEK